MAAISDLQAVRRPSECSCGSHIDTYIKFHYYADENATRRSIIFSLRQPRSVPGNNTRFLVICVTHIQMDRYVSSSISGPSPTRFASRLFQHSNCIIKAMQIAPATSVQSDTRIWNFFSYDPFLHLETAERNNNSFWTTIVTDKRALSFSIIAFE